MARKKIAATEARRRLADAQRQWIERVKSSTGMSASQIARAAGKHHTTLTNLMSNPKGAEPVSALTIALIAEATGVPASDLAQGTPMLAESAGEAEPFLLGDDSVSGAIRLLIGGRRGVDAWQLRTRALELAGYLPGDVVILDLNDQPWAGDAVCAQVYDAQRGRAETIWRRFEPPYLVAATTDPTIARKPLLIDDNAVIVKGMVLPHRFRRPRQ